MTINGKILEIPLIGPHSSNAEVKRVQGKKKIRKLLQEHGKFGYIGHIWPNLRKVEGVVSENSQDVDAQKGREGLESLRNHIAKDEILGLPSYYV